MELKVAPPKDLLEELTSILSGDTKKYQQGGPSDGVEIGEQLLGTVEDPMARALYNFARKIRDNVKEDLNQIKKALEDDDLMIAEKIWRTTDNADDIVRIATRLFWLRVHMAFPIGHKQGINVGIRNGWKVVAMKSNDSPLGFIQSLLNPDRD